MENGMTNQPIEYKLTLKGDGITVERNVSEQIAKEIISMVLAGDSRSSTTQQPTTSVSSQPSELSSTSKKKSLREYLNEVNARKNPQKILAIAHYLSTHMGKGMVSVTNIRPQFRLANEPLPANLNRDFQTAAQNGWIAPDHEGYKMFYITQTGLDALENKFE